MASRSPAVKRILQVRARVGSARERRREEADAKWGGRFSLTLTSSHTHSLSHTPLTQEIREIEKEGGTEVVAEALEVRR